MNRNLNEVVRALSCLGHSQRCPAERVWLISQAFICKVYNTVNITESPDDRSLHRGTRAPRRFAIYPRASARPCSNRRQRLPERVCGSARARFTAAVEWQLLRASAANIDAHEQLLIG